MGLLSKLKSVLGMGESNRSAGSGVDVTVEREADEADDAGEETTGADAAATGTDAAASTESLVDDEHADDSTRAAEPGEAAVSGGDESDAADDADADGESGGDSEPVSVVKGIGPAYADRLQDAGVETVADLAGADADDLADRTDLSAKRVGRWIENAQDRD